MKNQFYLLGSASRKCALAALLSLGIGSANSYSQSIVMPHISDNFITIFGTTGYPNSSTINYQPFCGCTNQPQLSAIVSDFAGVPTIFVNDQVSPLVPWPSAAIPVPAGSAPDVIVGNDFINTGQYIAGVVAISSGSVVLNLYHIVGVGTPSFAVNGPYSTITIPTPGVASGPAHIDIIGEYSTPYMGLPQADKFAITWVDNIKGIMAYFGSLNTPGGVTRVINGNTNLISPDVAAVERTGMKDFALFSYVDPTPASGNVLFYQECAMFPPYAVSPPVVYDNTLFYTNPTPSASSVERIDAIDDFTQNSPGGPNAYFTIATSAPTSPAPTNSIIEYNSKTGPGVATNISSPITIPPPGLTNQVNTLPVVACGPGRFFSVGYYSLPTTGGGQQGYFATSIDWNTGLPTSDPNAYMIDQSGFDPSFPPGLAVSASVNADLPTNQQLFSGWENYNFLYSKYTRQAAPYNFREAAPTAVPVITANGNWQIYPNPGSDHLILTAPMGFSAKDGVTYHIVDLSGRTILQSNITEAEQEINISSLPSGMYLLNINSDETNTKTMKFTKE